MCLKPEILVSVFHMSFHLLGKLIVESNALPRNSLRRNRQKSGIDCNVTAFVSGLRCTLSKTAVQRNPLQKFKIPTFGTVMMASV